MLAPTFCSGRQVAARQYRLVGAIHESPWAGVVTGPYISPRRERIFVKFLLRKSEVGKASEVWLAPSEVKFAQITSPKAKLHYEVTSLMQ